MIWDYQQILIRQFLFCPGEDANIKCHQTCHSLSCGPSSMSSNVIKLVIRCLVVRLVAVSDKVWALEEPFCIRLKLDFLGLIHRYSVLSYGGSCHSISSESKGQLVLCLLILSLNAAQTHSISWWNQEIAYSNLYCKMWSH